MMKAMWKKDSPMWKILSFALVAVLFAVIVGCDSSIYDDQIYPYPPDQEACQVEEAWRCNGDYAELCRLSQWRPWYYCAWNRGTCVEQLDEGGKVIMAGCEDPPPEIVEECPDQIYESDGGADGGPVNTDCTMCVSVPSSPDDFYDKKIVVTNPEEYDKDDPGLGGRMGCCTEDGNAHYGEDSITSEACYEEGCCRIKYYNNVETHTCCPKN